MACVRGRGHGQEGTGGVGRPADRSRTLLSARARQALTPHPVGHLGAGGGSAGRKVWMLMTLGTPLLRPIAPAWWLMGGHPEVPGAAGWRALTMFAVDASPPWGTGARAVSGVTGCPLPTPAHMGTAGAKAALWTGCREEMGGWPSRAGPVPLPCRDEAGREGSPVPGPRGGGCLFPGSPRTLLGARPALPQW